MPAPSISPSRSFSLAARKLHRTQPAVSQAVRRIEEELEDRLFDRSSRSGALTEAGSLLFEHAERLLRMASEAQAAVRELQQVRRGLVVIGANALWVDDAVVYPAEFERTGERLERAGLRVIPVAAGELAKAEGGVTCCSLLLR